ncbi:hypothetical protein B7494_g6285 [Chlorociboria aeruginascens]|nr:hypothetical protein B7494_g6285 [Chlorociboria aeruginascens]
MPSHPLVAFYEGSSPDYKGRYLTDILTWSHGQLEASHNYIQTLFPLPESSMVNLAAPLVNEEVFNAFRDRLDLRERLRDSLGRMLWFYGLELVSEDGAPEVIPGIKFPTSTSTWRKRYDHNHLRITRIIRSLRVLGLEEEALAFYHGLLEHKGVGRVSATSLMYWQRAALRPLNIEPDMEDPEQGMEGEVGVWFLREWERKKNGDQVRKESGGDTEGSGGNGNEEESGSGAEEVGEVEERQELGSSPETKDDHATHLETEDDE